MGQFGVSEWVAISWAELSSQDRSERGTQIFVNEDGNRQNIRLSGSSALLPEATRR